MSSEYIYQSKHLKQLNEIYDLIIQYNIYNIMAIICMA